MDLDLTANKKSLGKHMAAYHRWRWFSRVCRQENVLSFLASDSVPLGRHVIGNTGFRILFESMESNDCSKNAN